MPAALIKEIPLSGNRFDFEPEITAKLLARGVSILEVPISYNGRNKLEGKKIGFSDGIAAIWSLLKYRWHPEAGESANDTTVVKNTLSTPI
jgi:hypothetical protein